MLGNALECPADVPGLAEQAARKGLLVACHRRADAATDADTIGSSNSSSTILAARVPAWDSTLPNRSRTYYARLRKELREALGLPPSVSLYQED
jgi:hypothetical protein